MNTGVSGATAFGEATDDPHPLRRRRDGDLTLQHVHRVGERAHAVPAQLHIEVQPTAHDVGVVVVEAGQHAPPLEIDDLRLRPGERHDLAVLADRQKRAVLDRNGRGRRVRTIERGDQPAMEDQVGSGGGHPAFSSDAAAARALWRPGNWPKMWLTVCAFS